MTFIDQVVYIKPILSILKTTDPDNISRVHMLKIALLSLSFLLALPCYAGAMGNISGEPTKGSKQITLSGHLSNVYPSEEEARLKAPDAAIDEACGQDFLANVYEHNFHCKKVLDGYQCKQTMKATCDPR